MDHDAWVRQSDSDLDAASALSKAGFHSQAIWLAAQAVEKAHKAILVALGLRYESSHFKKFGHSTGEVRKILPHALIDVADAELAQKVSALEAKSGQSRYPEPAQTGAGMAPGLVAPAESMTDSTQELADAQQLVEWCKERIARAQTAVVAMRPQSGNSTTDR